MEEEEEEAVMDERIYVAVGREAAKNKSNLAWVLDNCEGNKICIVLVHRPAQMIPVCKFFISHSTAPESRYTRNRALKEFDLLPQWVPNSMLQP